MGYLLPLSVIMVWVLQDGALGVELETLAECTDSAYRYQGYTYFDYQEYRMWSHCNFPRATDVESGLCGGKKTWQDVYICDPDSLLFSKRSNSSLGKTLMTEN